MICIYYLHIYACAYIPAYPAETLGADRNTCSEFAKQKNLRL